MSFTTDPSPILDLIHVRSVEWQKSPLRPLLHRTLSDLPILPYQGPSKAIVMGLGSFQRDYNPQHPAFQLAIFLDIITYCQDHEIFPQDMEIYAQDPAFTELDQEILALYNISILNVPQAENMYDANTFYFMPYVYYSHQLKLLKGIPYERRPKLMFGHTMDNLRKQEIPRARLTDDSRSLIEFGEALDAYRTYGVAPKAVAAICKKEREADARGDTTARFFRTLHFWCKKEQVGTRQSKL